ncbi:DNA (cytosine-5-)-methyltransferase [Butyricicoccus faecihominis]|uniref:DNA cytosine methyltransferase n=1 Tax=Butyricicoccus faecihominis TaxID=1712515 RepID=UPI00247A38B0|nr:DNA (cytosine-5-)-methyltransferase [Butyricicoccus faecihominis]MCQ5128804.1 DNA (cytosine-5-)-methyltransferase [Butyricicoccus faecihominis]
MAEERKYKGIYQSENGTWYYRIKKVHSKGEKPKYYEKGGFVTQGEAFQARQTRLQIETVGIDTWTGDKISYEKSDFTGMTFEDYFMEFLKSVKSAEKYQSLYDAQLKIWTERDITTITDGEVEILLLRLSLMGKKQSYITSFRNMLKRFFKFARHLNSGVRPVAQFISKEPYKLRVLSLFSGIGAPEQALKELKEEIGLDYKLVGYCEWDDKASYAYSLLHNVDLSCDYCDVENLDFESCKQCVPDFDLLIFGSPCQDFSSQGKRKGFFDPEHKRECLELRAKHEAKKKGIKYKKGQITEEIKIPELYDFADLYYDRVDAEILSRSGLIYRAVQIILWKNPKFVVVENVSSLMGEKFKEGFDSIITIIQSAGYNVYYHKFNSLEFNVPQNRSRLFMVFVRDDLKLSYIFPEPLISIREAKSGITQTNSDKCEKAIDWFFKEVADEYYFSANDAEKLEEEIKERKSYIPNLRENYISCITTTIGQGDTRIRRTIVKDNKGFRRLSSEELMKFQGFPPEYGTLLRNNGYTEEEVGSLVGNSITVPVIKAILKSIVDCITDPIPFY